MGYNPTQQIQNERHAFGRRNCPECAQANQVLHGPLSPDLMFGAHPFAPDSGFEVWMSLRTIQADGIKTDASYLSRLTVIDYRACARALGKFFGGYRLGEIRPEHLMEYQQARAIADQSKGGWSRPANANRILKEVALLIRILRELYLWGPDQERIFQRLRRMDPEIIRALTPDEQHRLLHVAANREEWRFVYQYIIVALQTTASTNELRALRLGDILMGDRIIQIPRSGAKNKHRMRTIPLLTDDAVWAMEGLIARARELGSTSPTHFLFPIQERRGTYDPTRPMSNSGLKKRWDEVRTAAALPEARVYDLRHTGITRMAEAGVPLRVTMTFAGHMTERMQQHYEAISMAAKRGWGEAVWGTVPGREGEIKREARGAGDGLPPRKAPESERLAAFARSG